MNNKEFNVEKFISFVCEHRNIVSTIMTARQAILIQEYDFDDCSINIDLGKLIIRKEYFDVCNPQNSNEVIFIMRSNEYISEIFE